LIWPCGSCKRVKNYKDYPLRRKEGAAVRTIVKVYNSGKTSKKGSFFCAIKTLLTEKTNRKLNRLNDNLWHVRLDIE
jgi:hypothetical protein